LSEAMLPRMFTTTSGTATDGAPISSRPAATTSFFGSASSQRASQRAADEDARDDGQDPQYLLPSSQDETETRRDQSSKTYTWRTQSRHTKNGWGVEGKLDDISNIPLLIVKQITILCQTSNYASSSCDKIGYRCVFESYHSYTFQSRQQPNTSSAATISCSALDKGARKW